MENALQDLQSHIATRFGASVTASSIAFGELTVVVDAAQIVRVLEGLRDDAQTRFTMLIDICGADYPNRPKRFDIVYHLLSLSKNMRLRVKLEAGLDEAVPSIVSLFPVANWFEREAFDMYGVPFTGHPDMRRLLTDYGFEGYPLRKDFPLTGYVEVRYDDEQKRVIYEPVKLVQEFRDFDFLSPWEGMHRAVLAGDEKASKDVPK